MKKKNTNKRKLTVDSFQINEFLNEDVLASLKAASKELKEKEQIEEEAKRERERQRRIEKEKNKSFEELLNDSHLNWKNFK